MSFIAACAPSRDAFKQAASEVEFRNHAEGVARVLNGCGVAVFTEAKRRGDALFAMFGTGGIYATGQPVVTLGGNVVAKGTTPGHGPIRGVCAARDISWMIVELAGVKVGVVGVHPTPGHPAQRSKNPAHRLRRRAIVKAWGLYRNRARVLFRRLKNVDGCEVVVVAGDINHPGAFPYVPAARRVSAPGLVYLAIWGAGNGPVARHLWPGADHKTTWTEVRP